MADVKVGDVVRVSGVPHTKGKRFRVLELDERQVLCLDVRDLRHRAFLLTEVHLDKKAIDPFEEARKRAEA